MDPVILLIVFGPLMVIIVGGRLLQRSGEHQRDEIVQAGGGLGLDPVADLPAVTRQVADLLHPLQLDRTGRAFSFNVGGQDAFVYEFRSFYKAYSVRGNFTYDAERYWHAYVIPGLASPHVRVYSKGRFRPSSKGTIDFPEDPAFSKDLYVQGKDEGAIRHYLGPDLRRLLLAQSERLHDVWFRNKSGMPKIAGFHAGPEGVALVISGEISTTEAPQMASIFMKLAAMAEASGTPFHVHTSTQEILIT